MEHFDVVTTGLGPAGSALARKLVDKMQVIALDKKHQHGTEGSSKPRGGLPAPNAQRSFTRDGSTFPVDVTANPQTLSVKIVDVAASLTRNYQRSYINTNRHASDLRMKSLILTNVEVYHDSLCRKIWHEDDKWHVISRADGWEQHITTCYLASADGANPIVRRHLYPDHQIRKYIVTQQRFVEKHPVPSHSCIFDSAITGCYLWNISKDGYFIFGGAYPMKDGQTRFTILKEKMSVFQFQFGKAVKSEKCTVLFPSRRQDFICGKDSVPLAGEVVGFVSASSLEGTSYALDSVEILHSALLK